MIYIYKFIGIILIPLIKLKVRNRIKDGKEIKERYKERFGLSKLSFNNNKNVIWIHAASVGEFKSADYLITKYHSKFNILITTTTVSAAFYANKHYGDKIIHQFAPLDVSIWVKKFLKKWKPSLIIWVESDLWPATLHIAKNQKIKAILINLRLSPKSLKRWSFLPSFYNQILSSFNHIFAQSKIDKERVSLLSKRNVSFIGNLKLTNLKFSINNNIKIEKKKDSHLITIMLLSTHYNEESLLLTIFKKFFDKKYKIRLIIAPRHPERSNEIILLCRENNLSSHLESKKAQNNDSIMIIDSFGILSKYFLISDIVFVGGSLITAGGHNPIEPAIQKCAILTGPHLFNWEDIYNQMILEKACLKIENLKDLEIKINNLINDKEQIENMKIKSYNFSKKQIVDTSYLDKVIDEHMNLNIC